MKRITTALLATVVGAGLMSSAYAADLIIEEPMTEVGVVDVGDWSGAYIGVHAGWGWGTVDADYLDDGGGDDFIDSYSIDGWLAGVQAGANYQMDSFVLGIEGDIAWAGITGDSGDISGDIITTDLDWLGTLRGRAGVAFDSVLLYATAGIAAAGITHSIFDDFGGDPDPISDTRFGWVAGVGAEVMVTDDVSVKGEVLFHDFGEAEYDFGGDEFLTETLSLTTFKVGLNWHF